MTTKDTDTIRFHTNCGSIITADEIGDYSEELAYARLTVTPDLMNRLIAGGYIVKAPDGAYRWPIYVTLVDTLDDDIWAMYGCLNGLADDYHDIYSMVDLEGCTLPIMWAGSLSLDKKRELSDTGECFITLHQQRYKATLAGEILNLMPVTDAGEIIFGPLLTQANAGIDQFWAESKARAELE